MIDRDQLREALAIYADSLIQFYDQTEMEKRHFRAIVEAARLVASEDTLTITKVDGEWPDQPVIDARHALGGYAFNTLGNPQYPFDATTATRLVLDALLEGQPK